jgi:diguanylate cyclase
MGDSSELGEQVKVPLRLQDTGPIPVRRTPLVTAVEVVRGLDRHEFEVVYQPVVDLSSGRTVAREALVRWNHPDEGVLLPDTFLRSVERAGLGGQLTGYVIETATDELARLAAETGDHAGLSINIWPADTSDPVVIAAVERALATGLAPHQLTLEVTERRAGLELGVLRESMVLLARWGVRLSLDDFGMGESSLSRLQKLHFDEVKIDRSFVTDLGQSPTDRHIVRFATQLAHSLGMEVVGEGVETATAASLLAELGVDKAQGFYLGRPAALHPPTVE